VLGCGSFPAYEIYSKTFSFFVVDVVEGPDGVFSYPRGPASDDGYQWLRFDECGIATLHGFDGNHFLDT
jgi:hypothetical protein